MIQLTQVIPYRGILVANQASLYFSHFHSVIMPCCELPLQRDGGGREGGREEEGGKEGGREGGRER